ncbi:MAG: ThiF family adenylyltransferase [Motiliproteus sp.]
MYNYDAAVSRNIGWVTRDEQQVLRNKRIAIAGLGGVGGAHLITLARLGISKFNISDFDTFEIHNFNRQDGAFMSTVDREKLEVSKERVLDINPEADVRSFPEGINENNIDAFLEGVDLYVDSLDFFALEARKLVFKKCEEKGIPAITAAPLGLGCAFLAFVPGSMSFENYFRFKGRSEKDQLIKFLVGLAPTMWQRHYLVDKSTTNFDAKKGPSMPMSVDLCAGIIGTNALKILLNRGKVVKAPLGLHFDAYLNKYTTTRRWGGNNNPLQLLSFMIAKKILSNP